MAERAARAAACRPGARDDLAGQPRFSRLTLFACFPSAVRVFFGRCAIVRFRFAAPAALLMFFRAAVRCLVLGMTYLQPATVQMVDHG